MLLGTLQYNCCTNFTQKNAEKQETENVSAMYHKNRKQIVCRSYGK